MSKGQASIVVIIFSIIFIIAIFFFSAFILKSVKETKDEINNTVNTLDSKSNISNEEFGEPMKGSTIEEKKEKIKDVNIAPPELGG